VPPTMSTCKGLSQRSVSLHRYSGDHLASGTYRCKDLLVVFSLTMSSCTFIALMHSQVLLSGPLHGQENIR
jgi:hypothetical protein